MTWSENLKEVSLLCDKKSNYVLQTLWRLKIVAPPPHTLYQSLYGKTICEEQSRHWGDFSGCHVTVCTRASAEPLLIAGMAVSYGHRENV